MKGLSISKLAENESILILNRDRVNQDGDDPGAIVVNMRPKNKGIKVSASDNLQIFKLSAPPPEDTNENSTNRRLLKANNQCAMECARDRGFDLEQLKKALQNILIRAFGQSTDPT